MTDLSVLRRTAAEIAAAALCELFPDIELLGGGDTPLGFFYDFHAAHPVHLHLIEEKMRQIIREKRPIRTLEMVPFSAAELLRSQARAERADELPEEGLVELIQIGSFYDLSPGPHLKNTAELAAFKIELQGEQLIGWCHRSKEELKQFLKLLADYTEPALQGERMGFWKGEIWYPKGLEKRRQLIQFLKQHLCPDAFEVSAPPGTDYTSLAKPKVVEIQIVNPWETRIQIHFFNQEQISCLQSIGKTLTILGFDHSTLPEGRETDYRVEDGVGRSHSVVQVKKNSRKGAASGDFTVTVEVEKILALLLEKNLVMVELENQ